MDEVSHKLQKHLVKSIPHGITLGAILAGYISILETFRENFVSAAGFIVLACVLDMLDGRVARAMKTTSEFGVQIDSLADMVNYGLAPSLLFYFLYFQDWGVIGIGLSFLPVACAGIRLARFNVAADPDIPTKYFVGLPTTIGALVLAGFVIFSVNFPPDYSANHEAAILLAMIAILMVSDVQYEKSNILSLRYIRKTRRILTILVILGTLVLIPTTAFFAWGLLYIMYGLTRSAIQTILYGTDNISEAELDEFAEEVPLE